MQILRSTPRHLVCSEIEVIRNLVDSLIADGQPEQIEANLYSARHHLNRAIKAYDSSEDE